MINNSVSPAFIVVSVNEIAERAHGFYVERGYADGFDREDWLRAEREVSAQRTATAGIPQKVKQAKKRV